MRVMLVACLGLVAGATLLAAILAAILNLPAPPAAKFLLFVFAVWCVGVLHDLGKILDAQGPMTQWLRLTYITAELRNDRDGIRNAWEQLAEDVERENRRSSLYGEAYKNVLLAFAFMCVIALGVFMYLGVFGDVGTEAVRREVDRFIAQVF